jgi:hypothetical protein
MAKHLPAPQSTPPETQRAAADVPFVRLRIDGGNREERYLLDFELAEGGSLRAAFESALGNRSAPEIVTRVEPTEVESLKRALDVPKLRQTASRQARQARKPIPPCSLLGVLEVWEDGRSHARITFMADPGQAEQAGHTVPAEVGRALEAIYSMAAKYLRVEGTKGIRP